MKLSRILFEQQETNQEIDSTVQKIVDDMLEPQNVDFATYNPEEEELDLFNLNPDEQEAQIQVMEMAIEKTSSPKKTTKGKKPTAYEQSLFDLFVTNSGYSFLPMNAGQLNKGAFRVKPNEQLLFGDTLKGDETIEQKNAQLKPMIKNALQSALKSFQINQIIKPKEVGSGSGRYDTFVLTGTPAGSSEPIMIKIVIAAGEMRGHKFEKKFVESMQMRGGPEWEQLYKFFKTNYFKGKLIDLSTELEKAEHSAKQKVKRPFASEILDIGENISDVTLTLKDNTRIYISLKDKRGATFANPGYAGAFKQEGDTVTANDTNTEIDKFLKALGVDKRKIAEGLTAYIKQSPNSSDELNIDEVVEKNVNLVKQYLAAQIGYGYVYFRESGGEPIIKVLEKQDDALNMVGDVENISTRYPYYNDERSKSKQCTITIDTSYGLYNVEIRNTGGGVAKSLQCNIRLLRHKELPSAQEVQTESQGFNLKSFLF